MNTGSQRFRTQLGEMVAELLLDDGKATVNGDLLTYSLERLSEQHYHILLNGRSYSVFLISVGDNAFRVSVNGKATEIVVKSEREMLLEAYGLDHDAGGANKSVRAPMPGLVLSTLVKPGDTIKRGEGLLVLEAMKMENEIRAVADGVVKTVHVEAGDAVGKNTVLIELE
ncbi:MAG: acetyl-CoA carboxylase biotin carboxyl carrier protein subunit [Rhodothermales bacterium]|nr:acetyl-CoA carboxylase biotin carboxyl carrier protein subunit [Rhodothermales bacterium]